MRCRFLRATVVLIAFLAAAGCSDVEVDPPPDYEFTGEWIVDINPLPADAPTVCYLELFESTRPVLIENGDAGYSATWFDGVACVTRPCVRSDNTLTCSDEVDVDAGPGPGSCTFDCAFTRFYVDRLELENPNQGRVTLFRDVQGACTLPSTESMLGSLRREDESWPGCPAP